MTKSVTWNTSRPIQERFKAPKRHHSFPGTVAISRRLSKLSPVPTAATDLQMISGGSMTGNGMATPYDRIYRLIEVEVVKRLRGDDQEWLSLTCGREVLQNRDVEAALEAKRYQAEWRNGLSRLTTFVQEHAPQLFTMLVYTKNEKLLDLFCDHGIGDSMFPVKLASKYTSIVFTKETPHRELKLDSRVTKSEAFNLFNFWQWVFFVPELRWTTFDHPPLDSRSHLPFLTLHEISRTEFSIVYKGLVHRNHVKFEPDGIDIATDDEGNPYVAVKQLLPNGLMKGTFTSFVQAEYQALDALRSFDSQHLIKATAFYKKKAGEAEDLFFVFPWAEHGNLRKFWKEKIPSIYNHNYMKWVFQQLLGLADALQTLHHENQVSRHGDLKPENVLCFNMSGSTAIKDHTSCVLVISDVGLSRTHDKSTRFRSKTKMAAGETIAYAAPETELFPDQATSRRFDIWSLGCLYLEFIIWLLYGVEELERFDNELGLRFYAITNKPATLNVNDTKKAEVNPTVKSWIEHIKNDPRCTGTGRKETAVSRLIALVEKRLLVIAANPDPKDPLPAPNEPRDELQVTADSQVRTDIPTFKLGVREPTASSEEVLNTMMSRTAVSVKTGDAERAYAPEVCKGFDSILRDVEGGVIEWINLEQDGLTSLSLQGPESLTNISTRSRRDSSGKNQEPLDDKWEYIPDEVTATGLRASLHQLPQVYDPSKLCGRCAGLSLWSQECSFDDTAARLDKNSAQCALCRLLSLSLESWATLPDDNLHFFRFGSSLKLNNKRLPPIASLCTLPGNPTHIQVLREWIRDCDTHQCVCSQDIPFLPTRLLDVGKRGSKKPRLICETSGLAKEAKYLALSHRWGSLPNAGEPDPLAGKIVCTYEKNIHRLENGVHDVDLPPMYQDAIAIARELEVQYLWIDSLCIIQHDKSDPFDKDNGRDWKKESERMEQVFRSAYITLAASCASSPVEHFLKTRPERQCVTMKSGNTFYYLSEAIDDFYNDVEQGELNKRGWVLQERALSRRTIYFTETQTYWECGEGVRCETLTKTKNSKASLLGDANFPYSFPSYVKGKKIKLYQDLYERYSTLALSYLTDRPVAIRGLETRLLRVLGAKGGYGVFDIYFRRGLLWQRGQARLKRIDFSEQRDKEQQPVPSWSWMAYSGDIRYMEVPLGGVEWDLWDGDIVSPWKTAKDDNNKAPFELEALVRDIKVVEPGARVFLDEPGRTFHHPFKCVVVGSSKPSNQGKIHTYYALIVTALGPEENGVYERVGAAFLRKHQIVWDSPGADARIH
ncbi:hypothetical protein B0O99DRAFT_703257 [Bisporella sp. PMI_857]|nr:hypothetical protein B0O99DRAFT_703257 [Bisporella sp. PMI_857]